MLKIKVLVATCTHKHTVGKHTILLQKRGEKKAYLYKYWYYGRKSGNPTRYIFLQKFYLPIKEYISCFLFSYTL